MQSAVDSPPKSRVWLVNLFFGPGVAPTGLLLEGLALDLQQHGYDVKVLTGTVSYHSAESRGPRRFHGRIRKIYSGPVQAKRLGGKLVSWAAFFCGVAIYTLFHGLPDKVVVMTTPPLLQAIFVLRNLVAWRKTEIILWNQDTFPEILAALGLVRPRSLAYRLLHWLERWSTTRVDKVIALDQAMSAILQSHGARSLQIIPNWNSTAGMALPSDEGLDAGLLARRTGYRYRVIYTGNLGWGHDLSSLWTWLDAHPAQRDFHFLFIGGGEQWDNVRQRRDAGGWKCVDMLPYVPQPQFEFLVEASDFGLVALDRRCVGLMSPSKIYAYLAHGKPLLYVGPSGSNVADAIAAYACGFQIGEAEPAALAAQLASICSPGFDYARLSHQALLAAAEFSAETATSKLRTYIAAG